MLIIPELHPRQGQAESLHRQTEVIMANNKELHGEKLERPIQGTFLDLIYTIRWESADPLRHTDCFPVSNNSVQTGESQQSFLVANGAWPLPAQLPQTPDNSLQTGLY